MIILGLETSCDETSAAVVNDDYQIRSNIVCSQLDHARFGGVVPELASRAHVKAIVPTVVEALEAARVRLTDLDGIAVTRGPGLSGSLVVGLSAAKAMAVALRRPMVGVHHMEGHIFSILLEEEVAFPLLVLLVSGGHTELVRCPRMGSYQLLGRTRDDAAGEAFDKVAKILNLLPERGTVMGGRVISQLAETGRADAISFPRGMSGDDSLDFSFSGLKTAVFNHVRNLDAAELKRTIQDIAASFQEAVVDVLTKRTLQAMERTGIKSVAVAGGVAANKSLRQRLESQVAAAGGTFHCPSLALCTDNAAMIAAAGLFHLSEGRSSSLDLEVAPRLDL